MTKNKADDSDAHNNNKDNVDINNIRTINTISMRLDTHNARMTIKMTTAEKPV